MNHSLWFIDRPWIKMSNFWAFEYFLKQNFKSKILALLRCFQKFKDRDSKSFNLCLEKIAKTIHYRMMTDFESARVRDYSKEWGQIMRSTRLHDDLKWPFVQNIKTLSSKYYYDKNLFKLFCDLVDRDMDYPCLCKNSTKNICSKKCRALDFCALADVLDAIAQINYIYINKVSYVLYMYDFWSIFMVFWLNVPYTKVISFYWVRVIQSSRTSVTTN